VISPDEFGLDLWRWSWTANRERVRGELLPPGLRHNPVARDQEAFLSSSVRDVPLPYPQNERLSRFFDDFRVIVSEPLVDLPGCG